MWTVELIEFLEGYSWLMSWVFKFFFISFLIGLSIKLYQHYIEKKALKEELGQEQEENTTKIILDSYDPPYRRKPLIYDPAFADVSELNLYRVDDDDYRDYRVLSEDD